MKKQLPNIILAIVFLIGLCIFLYPSVSDLINSYVQQREIDKYDFKISQISHEQSDLMIEEAKKYNETLVGKNLGINKENIEKTNYSHLLSIDDNPIFGYLRIPQIDVLLPIYHGSDPNILQVGIGHLEGSSFPIEGQSVHSVISGHTGLPSSKLLTNLDKLEIGNTFNINILNRKYSYTIDQIKVVEPEDTDDIEIVDGKNYCTIVTCTPYGVNSHRLLVRGELIENEEITEIGSDAKLLDSKYLILFISIPLILILFIALVIYRKRYEEKEK